MPLRSTTLQAHATQERSLTMSTTATLAHSCRVARCVSSSLARALVSAFEASLRTSPTTVPISSLWSHIWAVLRMVVSLSWLRRSSRMSKLSFVAYTTRTRGSIHDKGNTVGEEM